MASDPDEMRGIAVNVWTTELRAGDAYNLGGPDADPNGCAEDLGGELLIPAKGDARIAIYRVPDGRAILVAATNEGLWGVDLLPRGALEELGAAAAEPLGALRPVAPQGTREVPLGKGLCCVEGSLAVKDRDFVPLQFGG